MKIFFKTLVLFISTLYITFADASCNAVSPYSASVNLGNIIVQRDAPVGQPIGTVSTPQPSGQTIANCNSGYIYDSFEYYNKSATSLYNVYSTNIPGVGISIGSSNGSFQWTNPPGATYYGTASVTLNVSRLITIYKIGPITSGVFQSGLAARSYTDTGQSVESYYISGGTVTQVACSITTPNVNVPLAPILASSFTSINSTKGDTPFTIGLNCDAGTRINASLSFTQNTDSSNNSVIQLTGAGTPSVATGVGIQLLYSGTILRNNTNVVLKTSTGGSEFPAGAFTARYFQTSSTVTTGDANATATLNLTYQ